jgi:drug/metabolite transporter (DMT)-like permease
MYLGTAIAALGIALLAIALSPLLVRFSELEISPYATAFDRFWMTTLVVGLWQSFQSEPETSELRATVNSEDSGIQASLSQLLQWQWLAAGVFLAGDLSLWAWALTQTSVANSTLLANLTPVFTTLGCWLFLGKCFDRRFLAGLSIAMLGFIAIGFGDWNLGDGKLWGDLAALVAALSFSGYLMVAEKLQTRFSSSAFLLRTSLIAGIVMLPIVWMTGENPLPHSLSGWLSVLGLTLICQILGQGFLVYSLNHLSASFVAIFLLLDPVLAAGGAAAVFSEYLSWWNVLAFGAVLAGIYLTLSSPCGAKLDEPA